MNKSILLLALLPLTALAEPVDLTCEQQYVYRKLLLPYYMYQNNLNNPTSMIGNSITFTFDESAQKVYNVQDMENVSITKGEIRFRAVDGDNPNVTWEHKVDRSSGTMYINMTGDGVRHKYKCKVTKQLF